MRFGLRTLWHSGMPWRLINDAIDNEFAYEPSDEAKARWVANTNRAWSNTDDPMVKPLRCPACATQLEIPWTTCGQEETYKGEL